jgi:hypothetical protein
MISNANLYWVLWQHLLAPVGLQCRYFFPFGTTTQLSKHEYDTYRHDRYDALTLFHFDQEPIYPHDDITIAQATEGNYLKWPRVLANSERSAVKKIICKRYELLDWYFFYHGFAALYWYRDAQYCTNHSNIDRPFINLNHLVRHKRSYRMSLLSRFVRDDIVDRGMVSFHGDWKDCLEEIQDCYCEASELDRDLIQKYLVATKMQPLLADRANIDATSSAHFGVHEYRMKQRALLHVVNETVFYDAKLHLTEKIFQPIVHQRPFVLVGAPGNLAYLRGYGFETFNQWLDESYDQETDHTRRLDKIAAEVLRISNMSATALRDMLAEMTPVLEHNKRHFFTEFRKIITHELVDNFDQCLRLWNNGRVNYVWPQHPDLDAVKTMLLQ